MTKVNVLNGHSIHLFVFFLIFVIDQIIMSTEFNVPDETKYCWKQRVRRKKWCTDCCPLIYLYTSLFLIDVNES